MGGKPKLSYETVANAFLSRGCKLLETEYVNHKIPMSYVATCGHLHRISYDNFVKGKGDLCRACRYARIANNQALGYEAIKSYFESEGCTVISSDFRGNRDPVRYVARCGHENVTDYNHFKDQNAGRVCNKCSKSIQYDFQYVKQFYQEAGCMLLENEYVNCKTPMRYIGVCGHVTKVSFDVFQNRRGYLRMCLSCANEAVKAGKAKSGRNSVEMAEWRSAVFERDDYTCAICHTRGGKLNAHHLNGYSDFPEQAYDINNGVTLCAVCHRSFHSFISGEKVTAERFQDFKNTIDMLEGNTEVS